jgi:hypothetical protein
LKVVWWWLWGEETKVELGQQREASASTKCTPAKGRCHRPGRNCLGAPFQLRQKARLRGQQFKSKNGFQFE